MKTPSAPPSASIAVVSDIHSNLHAFKAVLKECERRGINRFYCLGDIVGYGAQPAECLELVRELKCPTVLGNHDYYVAAGAGSGRLNDLARMGVEYSSRQLTRPAKHWLADLPTSLTVDGVTLVHASLDEPMSWEYVFSDTDATATLRAQSTSLCFNGHTHVPNMFKLGRSESPEPIGEAAFRFDADGKYLVNPGSVGQPRTGDPRAQFAVFTPAERTVEFVKVEYDTDAAADAILAAGLPSYLGERLCAGV